MGLDMYLSAEIRRDDPDPRVHRIFKVIDHLYPGRIEGNQFDEKGEASLVDSEFFKQPDYRVGWVRDAIAADFKAAAGNTNNWIGGNFSKQRITLPLGYWRKANQIHAWFVREVQDGRDECQHSEVSREKLFELRKIVKEVEVDHSKAPELLPSEPGFFFGTYDYDEWYFENITETRKILDRICESGLTEHATIYYQSSW